ALDTAKAAALIRARTVAVELATGLSEWARLRQVTRKSDDGSWKDLATTARTADPDERRNEMREAMWAGDRKALLKLAAADRIEELSPTTLVGLAEAIRGSGAVSEAVTLLRRAVGRYPGDFWVNHWLSYSLGTLQPPQVEERIRYATAAA